MAFDTPYPKPVWLIVFLQDGCPACHEAKPHVEALKAKYPVRVMIIERYLNRSDAKFPGVDWLPSATPAYALVERNGRESHLLRKRVGPMALQELERWVGLELLT